MGRSGVIDVGARNASAQLEAVQQLEEVARFLDLEKWIVQRLQHAEREIQVNLQVTGEQNQPRIFRAMRVLHSSVRGPGMGPLIFTRSVTGADLHARAMELSWQGALWKLPFCGSAGAVIADLEEVSEKEVRLLTREYVRALREVIGQDQDVITPELDSFPQLMGWAASALADRETVGAVTGKPLSMGGIERQEIAARFLRLLAGRVLARTGKSLQGADIAVLGFDLQARRCAVELERTGARIVAVADGSGAVQNAGGLSVALLMEHAKREKMVFGYPEADAITIDDLLDMNCDALLLCGPADLWGPTAARFVFEVRGRVRSNVGAGTRVIPALLADFGSMFASYCEWRKNTRAGFSEHESLRGLSCHIAETWREVYEYADEYETDLRRAAMAIGVSRMAEALRMR